MGNPKLFCIIGRSCSGKDTLAYILSIYRNIEPLVSYTTRAKRDYEIDGEEHYFITEEEYQKEYKDKEKLAYTEINGYRYFTLYDQLTESKDPRSYVIDPHGWYDLKYRFQNKVDLISIYVYCSDKTRECRYNDREKDTTVPYEERHQAESKQFDEFESLYKDHCDMIINTDRINLLNMIFD